jgi:hypothetical protein
MQYIDVHLTSPFSPELSFPTETGSGLDSACLAQRRTRRR